MISALLVDDEPRANEMMRKLLAAHAEIEIVGVAENVAEARSFLETTPPDVVFLDIDMPGGVAGSGPVCMTYSPVNST